MNSKISPRLSRDRKGYFNSFVATVALWVFSSQLSDLLGVEIPIAFCPVIFKPTMLFFFPGVSKTKYKENRKGNVLEQYHFSAFRRIPGDGALPDRSCKLDCAGAVRKSGRIKPHSDDFCGGIKCIADEYYAFQRHSICKYCYSYYYRAVY